MTYNEERRCRAQGRLFQMVKEKGYDLDVFVPSYMNSKIVAIDADSDACTFLFDSPEVVAELSEGEIELNDDISTVDIYDAYFIGWAYRALAILNKISSKQLFCQISLNKIKSYAPGNDEDGYFKIIENICKDFFVAQ